MSKSVATKRCPVCELDLDVGKFYKHKNRSDGLQPQCKKCQGKYQNKNYKVSSKRRASIRQSAKTRRLAHIEVVTAYLREHPCVDCGENDPEVLEFDHVRGEKITEIAKLVSHGYSWALIEAEIAKCDVRCANCHRRKTRRDLKNKAPVVQLD